MASDTSFHLRIESGRIVRALAKERYVAPVLQRSGIDRRFDVMP